MRNTHFINSVIVTALSLALLLVIALPAAYCLSRFQFVGRKLLNTCFMAGLFINVNYIVVPIFLMLKDGDVWLKKIVGEGFLLNNLFVLALVYASTALPFTVYAHAVRQDVCLAVEQDRPLEGIRPVIIMRHTPEACLDAPDNDRDVLIFPADEIAVYDRGMIRPFVRGSAGGVGICLTMFF